MRQAQALLVAFDRGFPPAAPLVIEVDLGQQHGNRLLQPIDWWAGQREPFGRRQRRNQHPPTPLAVFLSAAPRNPADRTARGSSRPRHPAALALGTARGLHPGCATRGQGLRPCARISFAMDLIPPVEQPVHRCDAAPTGINTPECPAAVGIIPLQGLFGRLYQRPQRGRQWGGAPKEPLHHNFVLARGEHAAQLPPTAVTLLRKVPFRGNSGRFPAGHPGHIGIEHLHTAGIVMTIAPTRQAIEGVHRLLHLRHRGVGTRVQRLLHHRLFGTHLTPQRRLHPRVRPHPFVDLDQAMGARQEGDKRVLQFLDRRVLDDFLCHVDLVTYRPKQVKLS